MRWGEWCCAGFESLSRLSTWDTGQIQGSLLEFSRSTSWNFPENSFIRKSLKYSQILDNVIYLIDQVTLCAMFSRWPYKIRFRFGHELSSIMYSGEARHKKLSAWLSLKYTIRLLDVYALFLPAFFSFLRKFHIDDHWIFFWGSLDTAIRSLWLFIMFVN